MVDSFSSHCVAFNEPGNKAVGCGITEDSRIYSRSEAIFGNAKLLDWSTVYFAPPFQAQVGVFFACDILTRVEIKLKSCSDYN